MSEQRSGFHRVWCSFSFQTDIESKGFFTVDFKDLQSDDGEFILLTVRVNRHLSCILDSLETGLPGSTYTTTVVLPERLIFLLVLETQHETHVVTILTGHYRHQHS